MTDNTMQSTETRRSCNTLRSRLPERTCFLRRFSQWLWSSWTVVPVESQPTIQNSTRLGTDQNYTLVPGKTTGLGTATGDTARYIPNPAPQEQIPSRENYPCKACQAWGVTCDHQRPRCAHCLDQQILCFYVAPLPKTIRRPKQPAMSHPTRQRASVGVSG